MAKNYEVDPIIDHFRSVQSGKPARNIAIRYDKWLHRNDLTFASSSRQMVARFMREVTSSVASRVNIWRTLSSLYDLAEANGSVQEPSTKWLNEPPATAELVSDWLFFSGEPDSLDAQALGEGVFLYLEAAGIPLSDVVWSHLVTYHRSSPELRTLPNFSRLKRLHLYLCYQGYVLDARTERRQATGRRGSKLRTIVESLPNDMQTLLSTWIDSAYVLATPLYRGREMRNSAKLLDWLNANSIAVDAVTADDVRNFEDDPGVSLGASGSARRFLAFLSEKGIGTASLAASRPPPASEAEFAPEHTEDEIDQALDRGLDRALRTKSRHWEGRLRGAVLGRMLFDTGHQLSPLLRVTMADATIVGPEVTIVVGFNREAVRLRPKAAKVLLDWIDATKHWEPARMLFRATPDEIRHISKAVRSNCVVTDGDGSAVRASVRELTCFGSQRRMRQEGPR